MNLRSVFFRSMSIDECVSKNHTECLNPWSNLIPYFCGHSNLCMTRNETALHYAKLNVKNKYLAVGLVEDMESSLKLFEHVLPSYFSNSTQFYKSQGFFMRLNRFEVRSNKSRKEWKQNFMNIQKQQRNWVSSFRSKQIQCKFSFWPPRCSVQNYFPDQNLFLAFDLCDWLFYLSWVIACVFAAKWVFQFILFQTLNRKRSKF